MIMSLVATALWWYLIVLLLGILFFPLTKKIFGRFWDRGYPFSKTIGILILSYTVFALATFGLIPFYKESIFLLLIIFLLINVYVVRGKKLAQDKLPLVIIEEITFVAAFFAWVWVRGQEPSIRGLEKFMDFGFIQSILGATNFPPLDMWYAGGSINYYYFGHLTGAVLTKLSSIPAVQTYNLILATIFALSITQTFSLVFNIVYIGLGQRLKQAFVGGVLGSFIVNLGGNLHTIYLFTKGYENEKPVPFWEILSAYNPQKYWYPNATRFIPFTIHEFPLYSYVVADLHGHVFDIPFVLLTIAVLFIILLNLKGKKRPAGKKAFSLVGILKPKYALPAAALGFLTAIHYMTNAFDGPIYILLATLVFFYIFGLTLSLVVTAAILLIAFLVSSIPFSLNFTPFVSGIGVNCAPEALIRLGRLGPFLFESGNCQLSPLWMLFILWGFFWLNYAFFLVYKWRQKLQPKDRLQHITEKFIFILFTLSTILVLIPEFFYIKDIYPAHFRANTMFKLGYQSFMMMGIASAYVFVLFKSLLKKNRRLSFVYFTAFAFAFFFIAIYPTFAITSYYGKIDKKPVLDGSAWILNQYPEYKEIIEYLNKNVTGQPVILEAQGDSYTDFNVVSSYTGLPTVAGWQVHQWLWRGSADVVGKRIPDIQTIYESEDIEETKEAVRRYNVRYIIVGSNEREKYQNLNEQKIAQIGKLLFTSSNGQGKIFSVEVIY